jgi:hypothetical protein
MQRAGTEQQRRKHRSTYARLYQHDGGTKVRNLEVVSTERREESAPCKLCGLARGCKHRPWMLRA